VTYNPITSEQALQAMMTAIETATGYAPWVGHGDQVQQANVLTIWAITDVGRGLPGYTESAPGTLTTGDVRAVSYQIDGYGALTQVALQKLNSRLRAPTAECIALEAAGVVVSRVSTVRDLSSYHQSGQRPHWVVTVDCEYVLQQTPDAGLSDAVYLTSTEDAEGAVDVTLDPASAITL